MECMPCQISHFRACTGLQNRPRGPPAVPVNRGLLRICRGCLFADLARNLEFCEGSADSAILANLCVFADLARNSEFREESREVTD